MKQKVTGIGGVFFRCKDPQKIKDWYRDHLGFDTDDYGCTFTFGKDGSSGQTGHLQWSPFNENTEYFSPSEKQFMINYRVHDLKELLEELRAAGVKIVGELQEFAYGKFAHVMDPEGNKLELWEPVDEALE